MSSDAYAIGTSGFPSDTKKITDGPSKLDKTDDLDKIRCGLANRLRCFIKDVQKSYHEDLVELNFIQSGSLLTEFHSWRRQKTQEMMQALCSGHLDPEDLATIGAYISGHVASKDFFSYDDSEDSSDEDEERVLDEQSLFDFARDEIEVLKRIADLKRLGAWHGGDSETDAPCPDLVSLPTTDSAMNAPTSRCYNDYLLEEVRWLAVDFKRERQYMKTSAKKLAFSALKSHRDRTKNQLKLEKDEVIRIRKHCATLARAIREWWRKIDKIVQAKHQVRLTVKRQEAMNTHLGRVLETTEQYTRWLTEGITGGDAKPSDKPVQQSAGDRLKVDRPSPRIDQADSDKEYEVESDDSDDDEETIEQEERQANLAADEGSLSELNQLETDVDVPLEELLPAGYLEQILARQQKPAPIDRSPSPEPVNQTVVNSSSSDEKEEEEVKALEAEAILPIDQLLEKYTSRDEGEAKSSSSDESSSHESSESPSTESPGSPLGALSPASNASLKQLYNTPSNQLPRSADAVSTKTDTPITDADDDAVMGKEFQSLAAEALSAQPNAQSTDPPIQAPFLLTGGNLREYQLVGLSWLVAIHAKRLNGILADEMGLGKTIQTIALLAHLACEQGVWGPHLIIVPTSVMLNWEIEFKRWCPGFKILNYYGSAKERKEKRKGWTKTNAFHVCITSYRLAIQDSIVFKRKKWKYLVLDEAQNIKNFKSQRWQTLLTFNSQRRLLLTGTPLQNSLMELWSLMHFLMPNIFQSHREFQQWFASPLTGMIEGNSEFNDQLVKRLHRLLRPFLLRRLKADVEKQMPKKYEHVVMCRLSRRQRFLYDDFMSLTSTQETLKSGQFLSVMNILMQLRKVCNHPNLFETRPIVSPFHVDSADTSYSLPRLILSSSEHWLTPLCEGKDWLDDAVGRAMRLVGQSANLAEMARDLPAFASRRVGALDATDLLQMVDTSDLIDNVKVMRSRLNRLLPESCYDADSPFPDTPFWPTGSLTVRDTMYPTVNQCPKLKLDTPPPPLELIQIQPAPRSAWDVGIPKAVQRQRIVQRQHRLDFLARLNARRCQLLSSSSSDKREWNSRLGPDLVHLLTRLVVNRSSTRVNGWLACKRSLYQWPVGSRRSERAIDAASCINDSDLSRTWQLGSEATPTPTQWQHDCTALRQMLRSPADLINQLSVTLDKFAFVVPPVQSSTGFHLASTTCRLQRSQASLPVLLTQLLSPYLPIQCRRPKRSSHILSPTAWLAPSQLARISTSCRIQFPDPRLIQYDCGKLQRLDLLLRELKTDKHRVLIFTQMTRMLDILEQFLAFHGHCYLRLDGSTKIEQRQVMMERFNQDVSIFVFILSTRSGGLGVNLTGADTVIFYDSDWNPTMDAQAQDRCHRIGQTRDVHIYRLISERTVEENILKKANQKRLLSDVAIEGGRFTTAFFKQNTISELFAEPSGLQDLAANSEVEQLNSTPLSSDAPPASPSTLITRSGRQVKTVFAAALAPAPVEQQLSSEQELASALVELCEEDESDKMAAKRALDEVKADLAEFDDAGGPSASGGDDDDDPLVRYYARHRSRAEEKPADEQLVIERELDEFEGMLRPIERFGVHWVERHQGEALSVELERADAELSDSKESWRLDQLKALHEADEERAELEEDDILYCHDPTYNPAQEQLAELERLDRLLAVEQEAEEELALSLPDVLPKSIDQLLSLRRRGQPKRAGRQRGANRLPPLNTGHRSPAATSGGGVVKRPRLVDEGRNVAAKYRNLTHQRLRGRPPLSRRKFPCRRSSSPSDRPKRKHEPPVPEDSINGHVDDDDVRPVKVRRLDNEAPLRRRSDIGASRRFRPQVWLNSGQQRHQPNIMANQARHQSRNLSTSSSPLGPAKLPIPPPPRVVLPMPQPRPLRPPRPPRPTEPLVPIRSAVDGVRSNVPIGQLLSPNGQPVVFITRRMQTASGEIYQQRFTHPVNPSAQFVRAVNLLSRPPTTSPSPVRLPTPVVSLAKFDSVGPVLRSMTPTAATQSSIPSSNTFPVDKIQLPHSSHQSTIRLMPGNGSTTNSLPVIRMINCDAFKSPLPPAVFTRSSGGHQPLHNLPAPSIVRPAIPPIVRPSPILRPAVVVSTCIQRIQAPQSLSATRQHSNTRLQLTTVTGGLRIQRVATSATNSQSHNVVSTTTTIQPGDDS